MLKKRSRPVSSKQGLMTETPSLLSPTSNPQRPRNSPLFPSPRLFVPFSPMNSSDYEVPITSPTSILETKPFSAPRNPFFFDKTTQNPLLEPTQEPKLHQPIGLGIVDALKKPSKPESRMVVFGSQLKIQIPSIIQNGLVAAAELPNSPIEFGVKNKISQLALLSPAQRSPMGGGSTNLASGFLSAREMENSEDYTCVISHGPNPRTTHIFDNYIVESCGGADGFTAGTPRKDNRVSGGYPSDDFLTVCHACKKKLGQGKDIFMYRGEKAFCSHECRYQEILYDEGMEDCLSDPSTAL